MPNENGTWIMYGVNWDDPECLWGYDYVTSAYSQESAKSHRKSRIVRDKAGKEII